MTFRDLHDLQERLFHVYVRNVMLFATLPLYLAQEMRRPSHAREERSLRSRRTSNE
ncbi:MAG TPA: hypothetical protein VKA61_11220 [Sphingomicrobium sp.]|nr:hypothetical protein [Sphingomicrobium sp.]